jgi:hypothetical protein
MFEAIAVSDRARLRQLAQKFLLQAGNKPASLLSLDHICDSPPSIQKASYTDVASVLSTFLGYSRLLRELGAGNTVQCNQRGIQRLFGFREADDGAFFVPSYTYLYDRITKLRVPTLLDSDAGYNISNTRLCSIIETIMGDRLRIRISGLDETLRKCAAFSICMNHVTIGCRTGDCVRQHPAALDRTWYNGQVRLHLQHILILQALFCRLSTRERGRYRR